MDLQSVMLKIGIRHAEWPKLVGWVNRPVAAGLLAVRRRPRVKTARIPNSVSKIPLILHGHEILQVVAFLHVPTCINTSHRTGTGEKLQVADQAHRTDRV
jgi:hypothetical protein